jgi:malonyl-ACP decarboxylase
MPGSAERRRVVVTGLAAMAGGARDLASFEVTLRRGTPQLGVPLALPTRPGLRRLERTASSSLLATLAVAQDALAMAGGAPAPAEEIGIVVAGSNLQLGRAWQAYEKFRTEPAYLSPRHGYEFYDTHVMALLAETLELRGPGATVGGASASGNVAIMTGLDWIRHGRAKACLVVGPLPELSPVERHALGAMGALAPDGGACRPFDRAAAGFVPGEACAAVLLESAENAAARGAVPMAEIAGAWCGLGGSHLPTPDADGEVQAMMGALQDAGASVDELDYVSAHATSTPAGDAAECEALRRLLGARAREVPVNATKSLVGHALQAAGVVELVALILQMRGGFVHGTAGLVEPIADDLWLVGPQALERRVRLGLSNSFGFGSIATSVAVRSIEGA